VVAAANATARKAGVLPGMPLAQLAALCPDAQWEEHDTDADLEELLSLTEQLQSFSPIVGIEELDAHAWAGRSLRQPQAISMEIRGTASWFGGEQAMATSLQAWLAHRGYVACIGIADTLGAAWGIANYSFRNHIAPVMEFLESRPGPPEPQSWIEILPEDANREAHLANYPIEALRLETDCTAKLHRLGIRTIAPLLRLPRSSLPSRFGPSLLRRIDHCFGSLEEPLRVFHSGDPMVTEREWEHPISDLAWVESAIENACIDLCKKMTLAGCGALRIACQLILEKQSIDLRSQETTSQSRAYVMQLSLFQASQDPLHLAWLLKGQLQLHPPRLGSDIAIRGIRLEATLTASLQWRQHDLFAEVSVQHRDAAAKLIDGLSARLGRNRVLAPTIVRDPIPEGQVRMRPLTGLKPDGSHQDTKRKLPRAPKRDFAQEGSLETPENAFLSRPTELIQPIPVIVACEAWGEPTSISIDRHSWRIVAVAGPERIESGWWSGPMQRREYYRIALQTGDWWWIYRDMKTNSWYLHGAFA
jgi:protein ImuB